MTRPSLTSANCHPKGWWQWRQSTSALPLARFGTAMAGNAQRLLATLRRAFSHTEPVEPASLTTAFAHTTPGQSLSLQEWAARYDVAVVDGETFRHLLLVADVESSFASMVMKSE